jgi:hypothetical protein
LRYLGSCVETRVLLGVIVDILTPPVIMKTSLPINLIKKSDTFKAPEIFKKDKYQTLLTTNQIIV